MKADMIFVSLGPSVADPTDCIKFGVHSDGKIHKFAAPSGWRGLYRRLLVWAIRRHVRNIND